LIISAALPCIGVFIATRSPNAYRPWGRSARDVAASAEYGRDIAVLLSRFNGFLSCISLPSDILQSSPDIFLRFPAGNADVLGNENSPIP
jgi:hypothetical protein